MASLLYLKHAYKLSDEELVERWAENVVWQHFSGMTFYEPRLPCDATQIGRFRSCLGEAGVEELLKATIDTAVASKAIKPAEFERLIVDTTVQEKAIAHPVDSRLLEIARHKVVAAAKRAGITLKQTFVREGKTLRRKTFAAFLEHTDAEIGRLVDYLRSIGQLDNTMIVLISDNGASPEGGALGAINMRKHMTHEQETVESMLPRIDTIGSEYSFSHYPMGWAQVSNTPLKWYKKDTHGGGIRAPLIMHWPAGIASRGEVRTQFHHVTDVMPTVLDCIGVEAPRVYRGVEQLAMHGQSMRYSFAAPSAPTSKTTQYFELLGEERADALDRIGTEILGCRDELGRLLSREQGKTLVEGIGDALPLDADRLEPHQIVAEIIMQPAETPLLLAAQARGCRIHFGAPMLASQIELMAAFMTGTALAKGA